MRPRRLRLTDLLALGMVLALLGAVLWQLAEQNLASWSTYEAFRCRQCNGPAAVNPRDVGQWACPHCGRTTRHPYDYFEPNSDATEAECREAGRTGLSSIPPDAWNGLPAMAWSRDRRRHWGKEHR